MMKRSELRNQVAIVGVGESQIGKVPHMTGLGLNAQAASQAADEVGIALSDIDGLLTAYSMTEPYFMLATVLAEYLGMQPSYSASLVVGGATPMIMLKHAVTAVVTGEAETVLVTAGENRATGVSRDQAVQALAAVGHPYQEYLYGPQIPAFYAMIANRYMHEYGTTREQMAAVAVNARAHAVRHVNAHMNKPITIDDVLESKPIADPLNMLDCCLISDAGGALIVTSAERAQELPTDPVYVSGLGEFHTHEHLTYAPSLTHFGAQESAAAAMQMAGVQPQDIDFAELYDCFSIVPLITAEEIGLAERGQAGQMFLEAQTRIEGSLPINTHGGMMSHAHAGAAGGLFGIIEAVRQLRGHEGDRQVAKHDTALVHNEGGIMSSHGTAILSRHR